MGAAALSGVLVLVVVVLLVARTMRHEKAHESAELAKWAQERRDAGSADWDD